MDRSANILIVDDDPTMIAALHSMLEQVGSVRFALSGADALRLAMESPPDLVLLDIEMAGMSGLDVCAALKCQPQLADIPVIFVTSHSSTDEELAGFAVGAVDFISKPPSGPLVVARVRTQLRLKEMADILRRSAVTDSLTGIANRRRFDEALAQEWPRAARNHLPLALLMIDVDFFKQFNDRYGHLGGDRALIGVAGAISSIPYRSSDLAARYGGEEFAVLLPETSLNGASLVAARIAQAVDALAIPHAASAVADRLSVSIGVSAYSHPRILEPTADTLTNLPSPTVLIAAADSALYAAKRCGRRQVRMLRFEDAKQPENAVLVQIDKELTTVSTGQFDALRA